MQAPVIRIRPLPGPALDPSPYDLICLTSANGVAALFERLDDGAHPRRDARSLAGARIAAIGPGTARALAEHGVRADMVAERSWPRRWSRRSPSVPVKRALIARAREARDVLPDALRARGVEVDVLALYETVAEPLSPQALARGAGGRLHHVHLVLDRALLPTGGRRRRGLSPATRIVSIGPITSEALREHGLEPHVEAAPSDVDGVIQALLADLPSS